MGVLNSGSFGHSVNAAGVRIGLKFMVLAFLGLNLWYRFSTVFDYYLFVGGVFIFFGICSLVVVLFPRFLKAFLFLFGASFFMFGFRAYDVQSQVFETVVVFVALTVFLVNMCGAWGREHGAGWEGQRAEGRGLRTEDGGSGVNRQLVALILCYVALSVFSLFLMPLGHIVRDLWYSGVEPFLMGIANATPNSHLYPFSGINRLILFFVLAYGLATSVNAREQYRWLFVGLFVGTVFCAFLGLLDFYGVVSLNWYRKVTSDGLQSTFLNRGWFAEFVLTLVPFVLLGFMSKMKGLWWKIALFSSLVVCELALILAGARAGWVSYPLILCICWLFSYFSAEGRFESFHFRWKDLVKVAVSVPITICISFLLIFQVLMPLSDYLAGKKTNSNASTKFIEGQASRLLEVGKGGRIYTWGEGFNVGREKPVFGMGYESFNWHANILSGIPESYYCKFRTKWTHDTPHSIFYQLFVSGGIVGVCLWLIIIIYTMTILIVDVFKNKRLINIPVVISIISFHMYGIFQSMQYIPMIWSIIFLNLGYAMTIDEEVLPEKVRRITRVVVKVMVFLVLIGGVVYFTDRGSQGLAEKYGLTAYAKDQDWHDYHGFYQREKWKTGFYRWTGKSAQLAVSSEQGAGGRVVEFDVQCHTPGVEKEPVSVVVSLDGRRIDEIVFGAKGSAKRWYYVGGGKHEFLFDVSRTWNPKKMGISVDVRHLGVAVSEPRLLENIPKDGLGFYGWETLDTQSAEIMAQSMAQSGERRAKDGKEKRFRWTGKRASMPIAQRGRLKAQKEGAKKDGLEVFLRCAHPGIDKEPVGVKIWGDGKLLRHFEFGNYDWKKVEFEREELERVEVMTFEVSRTWNPKRMGISEDGKDLGVAVAIP